MLTHLSVKGFKTLKDFSVPLTRVSVLVGPNNCGKSNVLRALSFLGTVAREGLSAAIRHDGGLAELASRSGDGRIEIAIEAKFESTTVRYRISTGEKGRKRGVELLEAEGAVAVQAQLADEGLSTVASIQGNNLMFQAVEPGDVLRTLRRHAACPPPIRQLSDFLEGLVLADFSIDRLRAKSLPVPGVELKPTGENLAAVLDRLHGEAPSIRKRIEREVSAVVPSITGIVTPPVDAEGNKVVGISEGDEVFKADAVSDGILLFIALSTVSQMSGGKAFVCLEEPDKGIHPRRIREILEQINAVAKTGSQFLLTTHSPVLLDEFRDFPESVLILDRQDGGTRATPLSELPDIQAQLRDVSLGDLWYSGVLGGVPPK